MKDIKDYLHFYIGCKAEFLGYKKTWTGDITIFTIMAMADGELGYVKPILRPLSDITESEAKELIIRDNRQYLVDWIEKGQYEEYPDRQDYSTYLSRLHDNDECYCSQLLQAIGNFEVWTYLLSKGFDLFGLIESGLAIDKTKM